MTFTLSTQLNTENPMLDSIPLQVYIINIDKKEVILL